MVADPASAAAPGNLGPGQRRLRLAVGLAGLVGYLATAGLVVAMDAPAMVRLVVAPFALAFALGTLQAVTRVCVRLAASGRCNFDRGSELVDDAGVRDRLKRRGARITVAALFVTAALTFAVLLV